MRRHAQYEQHGGGDAGLQRPVQHYAGHGSATICHPINENIKQRRAGKTAYRSKALRAAQQGHYPRGGIWRALFSFSAAVYATLSFLAGQRFLCKVARRK